MCIADVYAGESGSIYSFQPVEELFLLSTVFRAELFINIIGVAVHILYGLYQQLFPQALMVIKLRILFNHRG